MMTRGRSSSLVAIVLVALGGASCRATAGVEAPEASGASGTSAGVGESTRAGRYTDADVRFMQHMIGHHQQALDMTRLVPGRSERESIALLAERIEVSQRDEIARMRRWLDQRGETVPASGAAHPHHGASGEPAQMPGMLSAAELAQLEAARGTEFDRLFLQYMIRHHEGALVMVEQLFAAPQAGQETEVFQIASEVDADQRMEIERMRRVLSTLG